jgi:hypothetical protein
MATRVKGGMWCPQENKPVMAMRQGHAVRRVFGFAATGGVNVWLTPNGPKWFCPDCGAEAKVRPRRPVVKRDGSVKRCKHGVRADICAMCGNTKKVPAAKPTRQAAAVTTAATGRAKCRHGVRTDRCAMCSFERIPGATL